VTFTFEMRGSRRAATDGDRHWIASMMGGEASVTITVEATVSTIRKMAELVRRSATRCLASSVKERATRDGRGGFLPFLLERPGAFQT